VAAAREIRRWSISGQPKAFAAMPTLHMAAHLNLGWQIGEGTFLVAGKFKKNQFKGCRGFKNKSCSNNLKWLPHTQHIDEKLDRAAHTSSHPLH